MLYYWHIEIIHNVDLDIVCGYGQPEILTQRFVCSNWLDAQICGGGITIASEETSEKYARSCKRGVDLGAWAWIES